MKADGGCTCNSKLDTYFFDKFPYCRTKGPSCKTFTNGTSSTTVLVHGAERFSVARKRRGIKTTADYMYRSAHYGGSTGFECPAPKQPLLLAAP